MELEAVEPVLLVGDGRHDVSARPDHLEVVRHFSDIGNMMLNSLLYIQVRERESFSNLFL